MHNWWKELTYFCLLATSVASLLWLALGHIDLKEWGRYVGMYCCRGQYVKVKKRVRGQRNDERVVGDACAGVWDEI
jgi:hypothetical protein